MTKRTDRLLLEIEAGTLDHRTPIGDLLRKVITFGGQAGSAELRDWAARELRGYAGDDEVPPYRQITAPLQMDAVTMRGFVENKTLSPMQLPDFARDHITNDVDLRMGIAEIDRLARECRRGDVVKLGPPGSQELVVIMNARQEWSGHIERIYSAVSPVALDGVVEQVRTTLATLVAEINANMPDSAVTPSAAVATNAVTVAVTGKRNQVSLAALQGDGAITTPTPDKEPRRWWQTAGAVLLGLFAIAGVIFALMQVQGWTFG